MSTKKYILIFVVVVIGALGLKIMAPENAQSHFEAKRGKISDEEKQKYIEKAAEYDAKTKAGTVGRPEPKIASGPGPGSSTDGGRAPASIPTAAPVAPPVSVAIPIADQVPAITNAAPANPDVLPPAMTQKTASLPAIPPPSPTEGQKFSSSVYVRFRYKVIRLRLNAGLSDPEKRVLADLLPQACFVNTLAQGAADEGCKIQISSALDPHAALTLQCANGNDNCLSDASPPDLKIAPATGGRALAGDVSVYTIHSRRPASVTKSKAKIYQTAQADE